MACQSWISFCISLRECFIREKIKSNFRKWSSHTCACLICTIISLSNKQKFKYFYTSITIAKKKKKYDVMNWSNLKSNLILLRNENAPLSTPQLLSSSNFVLFLSLHPYKLPYQKQATKNGEGYGYLYVTLDEAREVLNPLFLTCPKTAQESNDVFFSLFLKLSSPSLSRKCFAHRRGNKESCDWKTLSDLGLGICLVLGLLDGVVLKYFWFLHL